MTERRPVERTPIPYDLKPMLPANLGERLPNNIANWSAEPKWNGVRALAIVSSERVRIKTRSGQNVAASVPIIRDQLSALTRAGEFVLDGELIWGLGKTNDDRDNAIYRLRSERTVPLDAMSFIVFDMPWIRGRDITMRTIAYRQYELERFVKKFEAQRSNHQVLFTTPRTTASRHFEGNLEKWQDEGFEGFVLKRRGSPYLSRVSNYWLKYKFKPKGQSLETGGPE